MSTRPRRPAITHPGRHAHQIGEKLAAVWHSDFRTDDMRIPVAVVAALSLISPASCDGNPRAALSAMDVDEFTGTQRHIWRTFAELRLDLAHRCHPLSSWIGDASTTQLAAGHRFGQAAIRAGLLDLTCSELRFEADVLGAVMQTLRAPKAAANRGAFYSPPDLCALLAAMNPVEPGMRVLEPTAGAGELVRAAAFGMRQRGLDPGTVHWFLNDIDPLAAACLAVNAHVWGLGEHTVVGCYDLLIDGHWDQKALHEKATALEIARYAPMLRLLRTMSTPEALVPA